MTGPLNRLNPPGDTLYVTPQTTYTGNAAVPQWSLASRDRIYDVSRVDPNDPTYSLYNWRAQVSGANPETRQQRQAQYNTEEADAIRHMMPADYELNSPLAMVRGLENDFFQRINPWTGEITHNTASRGNQLPTAFREFNADPAAWFDNQREQINNYRAYYNTDVPGGDPAIEAQVERDRAAALQELDAIEANYNRYGDVQSEFMQNYTSPDTIDFVNNNFNFAAFPNIGSQEEAANQISYNLRSLGIDNMNEIGVTTDASGNQVFYNRETGNRLPNSIAQFRGSNTGSVDVLLGANPDGSVTFRPDYDKPEKKFKDYMGQAVLATLLATAGGALGSAIAGGGGAAAGGAGSTAGGATGATTGTAAGGAAGTATSGALSRVAANMLGQGIAGGTGSVMQGGDFGRGFLNSAVGAGIGGGVGVLNPGASIFTNPTYANIANRTIGGALSSATRAGMNGGNPLEALIQGAVSSSVGGGLTQLGRDFGLNPTLASNIGGLGGRVAGRIVTPRRRT